MQPDADSIAGSAGQVCSPGRALIVPSCAFRPSAVLPRTGNFSFLELDAGHKKVMPTSTDARRHDTEIGGWLIRLYGRT